MLLLLIALAETPPAGSAKATLEGCEMTQTGWVCHYRMPPVTIIESGLPPVTVAPPPAAVSPAVGEAEKAEAARKAKLIARCADAGWMSLCLPAERREARRLREEAQAAAALRGRVAGLIADDKCDEAVKAALAAGDLVLAREARDFCRR